MMFLISTLMLVLVLITKISFVVTGKDIVPAGVEYASIAVLTLIIVVGVFSYIKNLRNGGVKKRLDTRNIISKLLIVFSALFVLSSFFINFNKKAVLWDAVALYDARAKFLMQGVGFSQMVELSKYDPQNSYYYVLYPPYTSMLHYFWYYLGIPAPVGVIYSIFLLLLAVAVFTFTKNWLGFFAAALLTFLVISNGVIFSSSLMEYTNLPFTLQMFLGIFLLYEYLKEDTKWKLAYGIGLIVTTMWIRFLEPLWVGVILALFVALLYKKKFSRELIYPVLMGVYGVLEYVSWQSFVTGFGNTTKIISFSFIRIIEPVIGIFTGSAFSILLFFVKSWGPILLVHLFAILLAVINRKRISFLQLFLFFTILIYYSGLYFVSFQSVWWDKLGDSLVRGSVFMIPISGYIILEYLHAKKN